MSRFNLSRLALAHQQFVLFSIIVFVLSGGYAYFHLGQAEDPDFTVRSMMIQANWPGATVGQMEGQVADKLEKKLQTLAELDNVKTMVQPGSVRLMVTLRDDLSPAAVPEAWYQVRKKIGDMQYTLPRGVQGPFFNDEFGTTYGNIFVLTGQDFSYAQLKDYADTAREAFLRVPDVDQVSLLGDQDQRIYIEYANAKLAALGIDPDQIVQTLKAINAVQPAGVAQTRDQQVRIQVSGNFDSVQAIRDLGIQAKGQIFRLGDVASVTRGYVDPPASRMYFNGVPALGLAISMRSGGDVLELGKGLQAVADTLRQRFPIGVSLDTVSDQPRVVRDAVDEFTESLYEAVGIVLVVCFLSLGLRTGFVVALCIPFVLAVTFFVMYLGGIDLQRISLGALIIGLGLMVDDAIIAVEVMVLKLEEGWDRVRAASFAYVSTAFPMLTGTLITVAGFLPVFLARTSSAEYTRSLFEVVGVSLIVSWFVAVLVTPYIGFKLLPDFGGRAHDEHAVYQGVFYRRFRGLVGWCVKRSMLVVAVTVLLFVVSVALFRWVPKQFFPSSDRPELIVDLWFPQNVSFDEIRRQSQVLEQTLLGDEDIVSVTTYAGRGSPRFYLPLNVQTQTNLAELVVMTKGIAQRERTLLKIQDLLGTELPGVRGRVTRLENGPPVGYPIQLRLSGTDDAQLLQIADEVMARLRTRRDIRDVNMDWGERITTLRVDVNQDQARTLGVSSRGIAQALQTSVTGLDVTQYYEGDETLDVVMRLTDAGRSDLDRLKDLYIHTRSGAFVPLTQIATLHVSSESSMRWRRNGVPTVTVQADVANGAQANDVSAAIWPAIQTYAATLPPGYDIVLGGTLESSQRSQAAIKTVLPLVGIVVLFLLMIQLQHMGKMLLVVLTAPLGMIGVTAIMLAFRIPFGFVAMLGVLALFGMIIRNSVILIVQIGQAQSEGVPLHEAIIESSVHRLRPILLTAASAVLAMIPLTQSVFWGPMAWAIMGGLTGATLLTLLFLPAAYALAFRSGGHEKKGEQG
ncbi:efflux RND transporter permease subunit [Castellaniella sp.]|uniref:efflux RND transporter permease subunit n=1 Tax=Castellaniella sp. TaxID=1955812 RepID=UPI002D7EE169|nr:efflux RND transporter permease subunit [Castellaniella sp.]HET8703884.1 efflux RND transporter permease subunit [Castellaniella sp.]